MNNYSLHYNNINLTPAKCIVDSRLECDTSVQFGTRTFSMPIYPSNMKTVIDEATCIFFAQKGFFYTMHRFGTNNIEFCKRMMSLDIFTSISIGINQDSYDELERLYMENIIPDYITIDVANAWSEKTHKMIDYIKEKFPFSFLIVGNVATSEACLALDEWGADSAKIGISCGKVCITRNKTGFSRDMVTTILDCAKSDIKIPLIADGGIAEHGDIAKALVCGAHMTMAGSLFAGYDQSAGQIIEIDDKMYKEYYGSASKYNKETYSNIEGRKIMIPYRGDMERLLKELKEDLQSSIAYSGANDLEGLRKAKFEIRM